MTITAAVYGRQSHGSAKSINDQLDECTADVDEQGWALAATHTDGTSASRYAKKKTRDAWPKVLAAVEARAFDVLVLWESSRGDRDLPTWAGLLAKCRERDVKIRVTTHGRTYDMANSRDWKTLADDGIASAMESEHTSVRTRRGVAAAAKKGKPPAGPAAYGYRRTYDPATGELTGQEPDPATAAIVKEIIERVAKSVPIATITNDLNARGVPAPGGGRWYRQRPRYIALNVAYIGERKHKDKVHDAGWPALVDERTFYAAGRILNEPGRLSRARPGRQIHLLSFLATCSVCGGPIGARQTFYVCRSRTGCVSVGRAVVDEFVTEVVLARVVEPDVYESLRQTGAAADKELAVAEATLGGLRARLGDWRRSAARGQTTPESLAVIEAELAAEIKAADRTMRRAGLPPALRQLLEPGSDVRGRWKTATLPARREVIRTLAELRISPAGQRSGVPVPDRLAGSHWVGDTRTWGDIWRT